jgi:hypothetical protein
MNNQLGLRVTNNSKWYSPKGQYGFLLNTGIVQNDLRSEIGKVLFTTGTKLNETSQIVFSSGWLQRHTKNYFSGLSGGQDKQVGQSMAGAEYRCELRPIDPKSLAPGMTVSLGSIYYQSESKKVGQRNFIYNKERNYVFNYGLGGGSQIEPLAGFELGWRDLSLDLHAGVRHRKYDESLDYNSIVSDAPIASAQLNIFNFLGCQLTTHYIWEPDLQILGGGIYKAINQKMSFIAQTDFIRSQDQMDDTRCFLGIQYNFGSGPKLNPRKHTRDDDRDDNNDWLKPVHGSNTEYLKAMRRLLVARFGQNNQEGGAESIKEDSQGNVVFSGNNWGITIFKAGSNPSKPGRNIIYLLRINKEGKTWLEQKYLPNIDIMSLKIKCKRSVLISYNKKFILIKEYTTKTQLTCLETICKDESIKKEGKDWLCPGLCFLEISILTKDELKEHLPEGQINCIEKTCENNRISLKEKDRLCPGLCPIEAETSCNICIADYCFAPSLNYYLEYVADCSQEEKMEATKKITEERERLIKKIRDKNWCDRLGGCPPISGP